LNFLVGENYAHPLRVLAKCVFYLVSDRYDHNHWNNTS